MTPTPAKTEAKHPLVTFRERLDTRTGELVSALPSHIPVERFKRVAITAVTLNTELLACDQQSLWLACLRAASDGLMPDGRDGAIVPFKDKAQWLPMVGGLLKRFRNSGQFKSISVEIVREGDEFRYWIDEHGPHIYHVPSSGGAKAVKAYAMAETKDGGVMIRVMSETEINKRRNVSRAKNSPLWNEWTDEAWMKTVLRNLSKRLPMSADVDELISRDDDDYEFVPSKTYTGNLIDKDRPQFKNVEAVLDAFGSSEIENSEQAKAGETTMEHIARDIGDGIFPKKSPDREG
jgi:recombination protein RecT